MNTPIVLSPHAMALTTPWSPSMQAIRSSATSSSPAGTFDISSRPSTDLFESFASSGGSWTCEAAVELIRQTSGQPMSKLARWIVDGRIVRFEQRHRWFIPVFQLYLPEITPRPAVGSAVAELRDAFDEHEVVSWFASPNGWLGGARPAELVTCRPESVIQAARADRFIANGD